MRLMIEYRIKLRRVADGRFSPGTRGLRQLRRTAVANSLREMVLRWDNVTAAAAEDRQRWRQRVAQCIADVGRIKVKVQFLPARCYASADTGYGPVSVCLSVCVCVCHKSVFSRNAWTDSSGSWRGGFFRVSTSPAL